MDGLLTENKKIYLNLNKIVSNTSHGKNEAYSADPEKMSEREYMLRMHERNRLLHQKELERNNLKIAQKIASA